MQLLDALAALLVLGAAAAFTFGALALTRSNDVEALYFLVAAGQEEGHRRGNARSRGEALS